MKRADFDTGIRRFNAEEPGAFDACLSFRCAGLEGKAAGLGIPH